MPPSILCWTLWVAATSCRVVSCTALLWGTLQTAGGGGLYGVVLVQASPQVHDPSRCVHLINKTSSETRHPARTFAWPFPWACAQLVGQCHWIASLHWQIRAAAGDAQ